MRNILCNKDSPQRDNNDFPFFYSAPWTFCYTVPTHPTMQAPQFTNDRYLIGHLQYLPDSPNSISNTLAHEAYQFDCNQRINTADLLHGAWHINKLIMMPHHTFQESTCSDLRIYGIVFSFFHSFLEKPSSFYSVFAWRDISMQTNATLTEASNRKSQALIWSQCHWEKKAVADPYLCGRLPEA